MSAVKNFGVNPAPVIGTQTQSFPTPVVPVPAPPAVMTPQVATIGQQTNPVMDAVAGPKCNIEWVDGLEAVLNYPTSPKEEMYFQDKNEPIIYRRETDGNGNIKNPVHALRYTVEEIPFGPEAQFVTKDEHQKLYDLVEKLYGTMDGMNEKLEKLLNG
ncbi:MAG: hypothetical protein IJ005_01790 [Bacteroidales bacterium]|nr:hypothetical protein [Bacteroidales bacterium]